MDSFVPRLQLNTTRTSTGNGGAPAASRLNHTAAPLNASGFTGAGYGVGSGSSSTNYNTNNTTSMTNNTMNSDGYNEGGYGGSLAGGAAPPSPAPRFGDLFNETRNGFGAAHGLSSAWQGQQQQEQERQRHADPLRNGKGYSTSGSRSTPRPSATRPLFTSASASSPRETYVVAGDTGFVPLGVSAAHQAPREAFSHSSGRPHGDDDFTRRLWRQAEEAPRDNAFLAARPLHTNAFTSTYVGTSSGAMPFGKPGYNFSGGGGGGVPDFDWRGGVRTPATVNSDHVVRGQNWQGGDHANGLVSSRSRARADRWTDEGADDNDFNVNDYATSLDDASAASSTVSSSSASSSSGRMRRRKNGSRGRHHRGRDDRAENREEDDEDSDDLWDDDGGEEGDPLSFADAIVKVLDAQPVVPLELLRKAQETPFMWIRHPSHGVILSLLQHRGIYLPRYRELVDYHMSELFLHYLDLCREGAYFVYYAPSKWPKERFFRIRMLPVNRLEAGTEPVPHLVLTLHETGVHIVDAIPLDNLVGVTVSPQAACFRPFLESPNTIIGCREGRGHRARMPVDGAFSLWFYDIRQRTSRSVDILTCDAKVFDIWTKTFRGLVSVNSSSVVQVAMTAQGESAELAELTQAARAESEIDHGERKGKYADK